MNDTTFPPIKSPTSSDYSRPRYYADLSNRINSLFQRYFSDPTLLISDSQQSLSDEGAPSPDDWMKLAILLAIKHKEPGFTLNLLEERGNKSKTKQDEHRHRDDLMLERLKQTNGNEVAAARLVERDLRNDQKLKRIYFLANGGEPEAFTPDLVPDHTSIREQFDKRKKGFEKRLEGEYSPELPSILKMHVSVQNIINALFRTASSMTRRSAP